MSLADELVPNKRYDKVEAALGELESEDREAWLGALESGDYSHTHLAEKLTEYTIEKVTAGQVTHYKRKKGL